MRSLYRELASVYPAVLAHRIRSTLTTVNAADAFSSLTLPILYMQGSYDLVVPPHNLKHIKALNPKIQSAKLPSTHLILQAAPRQSSQVISDFLCG